jgi:hypothetical protein
MKDFFTFKPYHSEMDQLLMRLRQEYPQLSSSQQAEKKKYARIFSLRDHEKQKNSSNKRKSVKARDIACDEFLNN